MSIFDKLEDNDHYGINYGAALRSKGITPGRRQHDSDPATYESDLVDAAVDKIMGNRDELSDLLGKVLEAPPEVADMLALLVTSYPTGKSGTLSEAFIEADMAMTDAIEAMVRKFCEREAGL